MYLSSQNKNDLTQNHSIEQQLSLLHSCFQTRPNKLTVSIGRAAITRIVKHC